VSGWRAGNFEILLTYSSWLSPFNFDLLTPWTIFTESSEGLKFPKDNDLDLTIQIGIHGVWIDSKEKMHSETLVNKTLKFNGIGLEKTEVINNLGSIIPTNTNALDLSLLKKAHLFPAIPRSYVDDKSFGTGNFIITILVTEFDEYGKRVQELGETVEGEKKGIIENLTNFLN
jgi:hypothetical protein